jgi:hypothetical protein
MLSTHSGVGAGVGGVGAAVGAAVGAGVGAIVGAGVGAGVGRATHEARPTSPSVCAAAPHGEHALLPGDAANVSTAQSMQLETVLLALLPPNAPVWTLAAAVNWPGAHATHMPGDPRQYWPG